MRLSISLVIITVLLCNCDSIGYDNKEDLARVLNQKLDNWHQDAADANLEYLDFIAEDGIYIGTATEEVWTKMEFVAFAKPYFEKGKTWNFKPYDRNIYFSKNYDIVWFNEKLDTWMGICRGTGILENLNGAWKIKQYNLSVSVPNEKINEVIDIIRY